MTDNEIIKGGSDWHKNFYRMELVKIIEDLEEQKYHFVSTKGKQTIADAILFIKKQNAEIERLQAMVDAELDTIHDLGDDYERVLEEENELVKTAKTEAYREFEERLKWYVTESGGGISNSIMYSSLGIVGMIDIVYKELTRNSHATCTESNE